MSLICRLLCDDFPATVYSNTVSQIVVGSQGLTFANGVLYESTGLFKQSKVRILDPNSSEGDVLKSVDINPKLFGEGMTVWHDKLVQITWKSRRGFIYDIETLEMVQEFKFETTLSEGWGITFDWCKDEFIVTDGSPYLHFWDPTTLKETRKVKAHRMDGEPAKSLNEIEFWRGRILVRIAESWYLIFTITLELMEPNIHFVVATGQCLVRRRVACH